MPSLSISPISSPHPSHICHSHSPQALSSLTPRTLCPPIPTSLSATVKSPPSKPLIIRSDGLWEVLAPLDPPVKIPPSPRISLFFFSLLQGGGCT
ncbi:uncharacterized protein LOC115995359 [Quercus lobata]|uniref:uncharacterized protein LOC115995359 n=1 Tax=Quercus lobata TaxID=97700 RepID=UPI0012452FAA|nr:uncharacterized protein LOC115995359 [Quercus lobata]